MELIRLSLLLLEGEEPKPDLSSYSNEQKNYHMALCIEGGLVHGRIAEGLDGSDPKAFAVTRLTWKGHEFLDAARNDTIWRKTLGHLKKVGVSVTLPLLEDLLKQGTKELLAKLP